MSDVSGKVAVVTGAAQGLGYAIAKAYVAAGMKVALMDVKADVLQTVVDEFNTAGGDCIAIAADLSDIDDTQRAIATAIDAYGNPDVLVHNAAILNPRPLLEVSLEEWLLTVNVQTQAAFLLVKAFWQGMIDTGGGSVMFVSSQSGIKGFVDEVPYCTAKHGLEGMMKALSMEGEPFNIAVNTVTPGMYMHTGMSEQNYPDDLKSKWIDPILLTPAFVQLAATRADGTTGQRLDAWAISEEIRNG
ncbi:MAG: SDR family NAD(P)-dependent oxidoreductase [Aggregatilineales bacterium]